MRKIYLMLFILMANGCAWVGTTESIRSFNEKEAINTQSSFYLLYPKNGHEKGYFTGNLAENKNSAKEAVDVFYKKYHKTFGTLTIGKEGETLEEAFKIAGMKGDEYVLSIDIFDWKDAFYMTCVGSTNRQGAPETNNNAFDSVDVALQVYDVKTKKLLNKQRLSNNGCPVVFLGVIPIGTMGPKGRFSASLAKWENNLK